MPLLHQLQNLGQTKCLGESQKNCCYVILGLQSSELKDNANYLFNYFNHLYTVHSIEHEALDNEN